MTDEYREYRCHIPQIRSTRETPTNTFATITMSAPLSTLGPVSLTHTSFDYGSFDPKQTTTDNPSQYLKLRHPKCIQYLICMGPIATATLFLDQRQQRQQH
ncbi:hypothetical protein CHS0354_026222 [Potamilus streckersoni]|uniref:Uncharacterized protein n=1 Tax=Potamilus streckersoni TaxID=2493646 RepID=A0AAE0TBK1_9BIVA|nr:hypothetical protein CHS0354_026222 [Potamilus streckersoni]